MTTTTKRKPTAKSERRAEMSNDAELARMAERISAHYKGYKQRSAVEQMQVHFAAGQEMDRLPNIIFREDWLDGLAELVPELPDREHARWLLRLSALDRKSRAFILEQTAIPMSNGHPLTLTHWAWVLDHQPRSPKKGIRGWDPNSARAQREWQLRELDWLRREAPSAAAIEHIAGVLRDAEVRQYEKYESETRKKLKKVGKLIESISI